MGQLQPAGGVEEEDVEVAVALEVAEDTDNDVRLPVTREIRQTEVSFMVLSRFCYVITTPIFQAIRRLMMRAATSRATMRVTETLTTMHKSHLTCPFLSTTLCLTALCLTSLPLTFLEDATNLTPASNGTASW